MSLEETACVIVSECAIEQSAPDSCLGYAVVSTASNTPEISSKWGGPRANSGGPRVNSGGARPGAGRKPKPLPVVAPSIPRWYCVRTDYGAETHADHAIRQAGFETLYPLLWVAPVVARRTELGRAVPATSERLVPLLSSYLFVRFNAHNPSWRHITTMRGVSCILSAAPERPTAIPDAEIACLRSTLAANGCKYPDADPEPAARLKKRWVTMLDGLAGLMQMEPA